MLRNDYSIWTSWIGTYICYKPIYFGKLNQIPENIVEIIAVIVALMFLTDLIISFNVISNVRKATKRFDKENPKDSTDEISKK